MLVSCKGKIAGTHYAYLAVYLFGLQQLNGNRDSGGNYGDRSRGLSQLHITCKSKGAEYAYYDRRMCVQKLSEPHGDRAAAGHEEYRERCFSRMHCTWEDSLRRNITGVDRVNARKKVGRQHGGSVCGWLRNNHVKGRGESLSCREIN